jgi:hypothetical protein
MKLTVVDHPSGRKLLLKEIVRDEVVFGTGSTPRLDKNRLTRQFFWQLPVGLLGQEVYTPWRSAREAAPGWHSPGERRGGENPIPSHGVFPVELILCAGRWRVTRQAERSAAEQGAKRP